MEIVEKKIRPIDLDLDENKVELLSDQIKEFNVMAITNSKIKEFDWDTYYQISQNFFSLPKERKEELKGPIPGLNGYFPFNFETALNFKEADPKEFWHITRPREIYGEMDHPVNFWPIEVPEFKEQGLKLFTILDEISAEVLTLIEKLLGFEEGKLNNLCLRGCSVLRTLNYNLGPNENVFLASPHTGIQLIGLQPPATGPGLQFYKNSIGWFSVKFDVSGVLINIGEMLQELSGNRLQATLHRVVKDKGIIDRRMAAVFFHHLYWKTKIGDLRNEESQDWPMAMEWLKTRIKEISKNGTLI